MKKKVLALFLSIALCVTVLPATGMAAEFGSGDAEIVENAADSQEMFSAEETTEPMGETGQPAEDSEDISEGTVDNSSGVIMEDVENTENAENSEDAFGEADCPLEKSSWRFQLSDPVCGIKVHERGQDSGHQCTDSNTFRFEKGKHLLCSYPFL